MRGVNKVIIVGNLGNDPDVKRFDNGGMITNISVATSEKWTDKQTGELREVTEWHRIVFNNKLAEIAAQYLRKGSQVYVEGSLRTRKYQDQNGQDRYITEIRADKMQMLGGRSDAQYQSEQQSQAEVTYQRNPISHPQQQWPKPPPQQQQWQPPQLQQAQPPRQSIYDDNVPF